MIPNHCSYLRLLSLTVIRPILEYSLYDEYFVGNNDPGAHVTSVLVACTCGELLSSGCVQEIFNLRAEMVYTTRYSSTNYAHGISTANWTTVGTIDYVRLLTWAQHQFDGAEVIDITRSPAVYVVGSPPQRIDYDIAVIFHFEHRIRRCKDALVIQLDNYLTWWSCQLDDEVPIWLDHIIWKVCRLQQIWCETHIKLEEMFIFVIKRVMRPHVWLQFMFNPEHKFDAEQIVFSSTMLARLHEGFGSSGELSSSMTDVATYQWYYLLFVHSAIYDDNMFALNIALVPFDLMPRDIWLACETGDETHPSMRSWLNMLIAADAVNIVTELNLWNTKWIMELLPSILRRPRLYAACLARNKLASGENSFAKHHRLEDIMIMPALLAPLLPVDLTWNDIIMNNRYNNHNYVGHRMFTTLIYHHHCTPSPEQICYLVRYYTLVAPPYVVLRFIEVNLSDPSDRRLDIFLETLPVLTQGNIYVLLHLLNLFYRRECLPHRNDVLSCLSPRCPLDIVEQWQDGFRLGLLSTSVANKHRIILRSVPFPRLLITSDSYNMNSSTVVILVCTIGKQQVMYVPADVETEIIIFATEPVYTVTNCPVNNCEWLTRQLRAYFPE